MSRRTWQVCHGLWDAVGADAGPGSTARSGTALPARLPQPAVPHLLGSLEAEADVFVVAGQLFLATLAQKHPLLVLEDGGLLLVGTLGLRGARKGSITGSPGARHLPSPESKQTPRHGTTPTSRSPRPGSPTLGHGTSWRTSVTHTHTYPPTHSLTHSRTPPPGRGRSPTVPSTPGAGSNPRGVVGGVARGGVARRPRPTAAQHPPACPPS